MSVIVKQKIKILKKPVLLIGLPALALVAKIAVDSFVEKTKSEKIGEIYSYSFLPSVIARNGVAKAIKDEFFLIRGKERDFIVLKGLAQPSLFDSCNNESHYEFAKAVIDAAKKWRVKEIYSFGGIDIGDVRISKKPALFYIKNEFAKDIKGIKSFKDEITISGISGLSLAFASEHKIPAYCVLVETTSKLVYGDFEAAKKILQFIMKLTGINIDTKGISKEAKKISDAFKQIKKELEKASKQKKQEDLSYVR